VPFSFVWALIKAMLARISERRTREGWVGEGIDLFGATPVPAGAGPS
jgi:hypothetical protein